MYVTAQIRKNRQGGEIRNEALDLELPKPKERVRFSEF